LDRIALLPAEWFRPRILPVGADIHFASAGGICFDARQPVSP